MAIVTPSDRLTSIRNRFVVEAVVGFFVLSIGFLFFDGIGAFVKRFDQISSFISFYCIC